MKLTEAKLKQLIKEVMTEGEGAKGIADIPDGVYVVVEKVSDAYIISYKNEEGKSPSKSHGLKGTVVINEPQLADEYPCSGALMVSWSSASHGFGPLLYDVAMEIATLYAGGLVSDRNDVSWYNSDGSDGGAEKIWNYYFTNRSGDGGDVTVSQLDDEDNTLTYPEDDPEGREPIDSDNCLQNSTDRAAKRLGISWEKHPLSKLYKKQPTTLKALGNKLRTVGF